MPVILPIQKTAVLKDVHSQSTVKAVTHIVCMHAHTPIEAADTSKKDEQQQWDCRLRLNLLVFNLLQSL